MSQRVIAEALERVVDPELALDIVSLGLVYGILERPGEVVLQLTTTTDGCPMSDYILDAARQITASVAPESCVKIELVHEPRWDVEMMSDEARQWLGLPARRESVTRDRAGRRGP